MINLKEPNTGIKPQNLSMAPLCKNGFSGGI